MANHIRIENLLQSGSENVHGIRKCAWAFSRKKHSFTLATSLFKADSEAALGYLISIPLQDQRIIDAECTERYEGRSISDHVCKQMALEREIDITMNMRYRFNEFKRGRTTVFGEERPRRLSDVVTEQIVEKVRGMILDRRMKVHEVIEAVGVSYGTEIKILNEKVYFKYPPIADCAVRHVLGFPRVRGVARDRRIQLRLMTLLTVTHGGQAPSCRKRSPVAMATPLSRENY
ncbi:hypothetical protein EVAR_22945_1 [Eumeta japonica]|uniref:Uncharacterized protein n=1 Tax=Eumeta variegata TaxID=151549 RepID=A0A4C1UU69_EUMVA|nr:hypothetical protein EVAR_22945_1 [Eumeta japonica]